MDVVELSVVARWRNLIRDSGLDRTAKLVAYTLSTYMSRDGEAFPSKATLAAGAGLGSTRSVDAAVDRLEASGLLHVRRSKGRHSFRYRAADATLNGAAAAALNGANPAADDTEPRSSRHPTLHALRPKAVESESESVSIKSERAGARGFEEYDGVQ